MRGDFDAEPEPQQRRFIDHHLDGVHRSLESLFELEEEGVSIGSPSQCSRTKPARPPRTQKRYPSRPFHIHTSEQPKENAGCQERYGMSPVALLDANGCLDQHTVLVHTTHVNSNDIELIAKTQNPSLLLSVDRG